MCLLQVVERRFYSKHLLLRAVRSKAVINQVANEFLCQLIERFGKMFTWPCAIIKLLITERENLASYILSPSSK